ncbi:MAG: T9SS type A sorting domain-containing protein [bacterium]|nr:T9SS type A sorting domain-containing protein [bacterium]
MKTLVYCKLGIIFLLFYASNIYSQINIKGEPYSFKKKTEVNDDVSFEEMRYVDVEKNLKENEINKGEGPWKFGENIYVNLNPQNSGKIEILQNGDKLWRLGIKSKGALTINLAFNKYKLPEGAVLYIYNKDKSHVIGGFTEQNNQEDGVFATTLVKGDEIIIEYFEPSDVDFPGELNLNRVTHGYRGVGDYSKGLGTSGDCNMNVLCSDADDWRDQIRSVCMIVSDGNGFCTGALINNTDEDGTPYILSANHCVASPSLLVFWFNWESETCTNPINSPSYNSLSGAVTRSSNYLSDFWLIEMNNKPPIDYNVYYSGWSIENMASTKSVSVHHPDGDIKKISFDDDPCVSSDYGPSPYSPDSHWEIQSWDRLTTTEPGSSGAPLYDQNRRIIGQLHGGDAACGNTYPDYYGKMSVSWDRGGSSSSRLSDWLDPQNFGLLTLDGIDQKDLAYDLDIQVLNVISPINEYIGGEIITPIITVRNRGIQTVTTFTAKYQINEGNFVAINWTGSLASAQTVNIEFDEVLINEGVNDFFAIIDLPNGSTDQNPENNEYEKEFSVFTKIFEDDFETNKGWILSGEFEIDEPNGLGGSSGSKDPSQAFSGSNILGTDLTGLGEYKGDYEENLDNKEYEAQSPVIDCSRYREVNFSFKRWLGTGSGAAGDSVYIDVYSDGKMNNIWRNPLTDIVDLSWEEVTFDISEYADNKKVVLKFSLGETNDNRQYCGWNIDNLILYGVEDEKAIKTIREDKIQVYPNPSDGKFTIDVINRNNSGVKIQIIDLVGKIVYENKYTENQIGIHNTETNEKSLIYIDNLGKLSGFYILKILIGGESYSEKIFIKN